MSVMPNYSIQPSIAATPTSNYVSLVKKESAQKVHEAVQRNMPTPEPLETALNVNDPRTAPFTNYAASRPKVAPILQYSSKGTFMNAGKGAFFDAHF